MVPFYVLLLTHLSWGLPVLWAGIIGWMAARAAIQHTWFRGGTWAA